MTSVTKLSNTCTYENNYYTVSKCLSDLLKVTKKTVQSISFTIPKISILIMIPFIGIIHLQYTSLIMINFIKS